MAVVIEKKAHIALITDSHDNDGEADLAVLQCHHSLHVCSHGLQTCAATLLPSPHPALRGSSRRARFEIRNTGLKNAPYQAVSNATNEDFDTKF